jgi:hypothetical protein
MKPFFLFVERKFGKSLSFSLFVFHSISMSQSFTLYHSLSSKYLESISFTSQFLSIQNALPGIFLKLSYLFSNYFFFLNIFVTFQNTCACFL